jgi:hypothetical protein
MLCAWFQLWADTFSPAQLADSFACSLNDECSDGSAAALMRFALDPNRPENNSSGKLCWNTFDVAFDEAFDW